MSQLELKPEQRCPAPARKAILFSALTLLSGIIIGAGLTLIVTGRAEPRKPLPDVRTVKRITRELNLSPQQRQQLAPIVQRHLKAMDDIRQQARPKIMEELEQMNDGIMTILDERQKQAWQLRVKRMQKHFGPMHRRRGPGEGRKNRRGPDFQPRHPEGRFHQRRPSEGQLPPEERRPVDPIAPPSEPQTPAGE